VEQEQVSEYNFILKSFERGDLKSHLFLILGILTLFFNKLIAASQLDKLLLFFKVLYAVI
jgi:hypothetical protein